MYECTVHILAVGKGADVSLQHLTDAGYLAASHRDIETARQRMRADRRGSVWLLRFDSAGESLMRWAQENAPQARIIALLDRPRGSEVHEAYQLGAVFCTSTKEADVLRAVEFASSGLDLTGRSRRRLRSLPATGDASDEGVVRLPAPRSA